MIYISIDNDHQGGLALALIRRYQLDASQVIFISVTSSRNNIVPQSGFATIPVRCHPLCDGSSYKNPLTYLRSIDHQRVLNRTVEFQTGDVLIVTTEYQINNALLAQNAKRAGGKVYLYDEGIGFYFNNTPLRRKKTGFQEYIYLGLHNFAFWILGIPAYAKKGFEGGMHVRIKDDLIDRIYSRMRLPIDRSSVICGYRNLLASEAALESKVRDTAIFFANNLTCFGVQNQEVKLSENALHLMASRFSKVYLKIHPADVAEGNEVFDFYAALAEKFSNIQLVETAITANEAIEQLRPHVVVGSLGASLFDAFFFGCQPIFFFHLLPEVEEFEVCKVTLDGIGYTYIKNLDEISPDYNCGVNVEALLYEDNDKDATPWWKPLDSDDRNDRFTKQVTAVAASQVSTT